VGVGWGQVAGCCVAGYYAYASSWDLLNVVGSTIITSSSRSKYIRNKSSIVISWPASLMLLIGEVLG